MPDNGTHVQLFALEDFRRTLGARLREVDAMLDNIISNLGGKHPGLGTFEDGLRQADNYARLHAEYVDRVTRLRSALIATQAATDDILINYATTEAGADSSAAHIGSTLAEVYSALEPGHVSA